MKSSFPGNPFLRVAEREQRQTASDLHDGLCQNLVGLSFFVQVLSRKARAGKRIGKDEIEKIVVRLNESVDQVRLTFQEQSIALGAMELGCGLKNLTSSVSAKIDCQFTDSRTRKVSSPQISQALYRIAHEALRNAVSHSKSKSITVTLSDSNKQVILTICDEGCGFKANSKREAAFPGIEMMRLYADSIQGSLSIQSKQGKGTTVRCTCREKTRLNRSDRI